MKDEKASERAIALVHEAVDVLRRAECAPDSPVSTFLTAEMRRKSRRAAGRLREQKAQPRYRNLHSAEELSVIYERTVRRDEIHEKAKRDLQRISLEMKRIRKEKAPEVEEAMVKLVHEAARAAEEHGPGSEAAQRLRLMQFLASFGQQVSDQRRKPRVPFAWGRLLGRDRSMEARYELTAAEVLDSPPSPEEAVIAVPAEGSGSGRERVFIRIGLGDASWIGSFEIGHMSVGTVCMMPDDKHLFVSAKGAGYIIDLRSRTLVEEIGNDVARVLLDAPRTVLVVDHDGRSLEGFGRNGRLWKSGVISSGGFRELSLSDDSLIGEAREASGWTDFFVDLATGEVRFGDAAAVPKSLE
ncbi:MAG: hypothetical protein WB973_09490 [Thermoanaerobaculia bacterium]